MELRHTVSGNWRTRAFPQSLAPVPSIPGAHFVLIPGCHVHQRSCNLSEAICSPSERPAGLGLEARMLCAPSPTGCPRSPRPGKGGRGVREGRPLPEAARPPYLSWRGSQSTPGSSSRAAWRTSSLSMEKLRRWPACATATRIHSISGGSTRKGLQEGAGGGEERC